MNNDNFNSIDKMKILNKDPFDFEIDIRSIIKEGLEINNKRKKIKDYIIFFSLAITILMVFLLLLITNRTLLIIIELVIGTLLPLSIIPITIYRFKEVSNE